MKEAGGGGTDVIRAPAHLLCKAGTLPTELRPHSGGGVRGGPPALAMSIEAAQVRAANGSYR